MLVFPDPNDSTEYTDPNGDKWEFNGTGWVRQPESSGGGGGGDFTLSAEADGDISSGASVVLNSDGSVSEIRLVNMPPSYEGGSPIPEIAWTPLMAVGYHPISNKIICVYRGANNYPHIVSAYYSDGNFVWGTPRVIRSEYLDGLCKKILVGTDGMIHGAVVRGTISYYFRYSVDGDDLKQEVAPFFLFNPNLCIARDGVYNIFTNTTSWVGTYDTSPNDLLVSTIDASGSATQQTISGLRNAGTNKTRCAIGYDEGQNKYLIANHNSMVVGTMAGTTMSFSPIASFNIYGNNGAPSLCYDPQSQTTLLTHSLLDRYGGGWDANAVTANSMWAITCKISPDGQSVAFDGGANISPTTSASPHSFYDESAKSVVVIDSVGRYLVVRASVGGDVIDVVEGPDTLDGYLPATGAPFQKDGRFVYTEGATGGGQVRVATIGVNAPSADHKDFIGLSSGDFADGEVAVIDAAGAVNNKQSGLSAGTSYYVKKDGDLSDADTGVFAGTGVSDNEIQVRR